MTCEGIDPHPQSVGTEFAPPPVLRVLPLVIAEFLQHRRISRPCPGLSLVRRGSLAIGSFQVSSETLHAFARVQSQDRAVSVPNRSTCSPNAPADAPPTAQPHIRTGGPARPPPRAPN